MDTPLVPLADQLRVIRRDPRFPPDAQMSTFARFRRDNPEVAAGTSFPVFTAIVVHTPAIGEQLLCLEEAVDLQRLFSALLEIDDHRVSPEVAVAQLNGEGVRACVVEIA